MTLLSLFVPLVVAAGLGVAVTAAHRRLPPPVASRAITATLVIIAMAALPSLWVVSLTFLAHLSVFDGRIEWCAHVLGMHDEVPWYVGLPFTGAVLVGLLRMRSVVGEHQRLRHELPGAVAITDNPRPFAFTLPGRGGQVVISSGLVAMLEPHEQRIVIAHERAHAHHRHDRYLLVAHVAAAALPPLRPLAGRLQFSLERWADEAAVVDCGDRQLVARTLGKVALRSVTPIAVMSFAGLGVPARVAALLSPPSRQLHVGPYLVLWAAIAATGIMSVYQLHHLARLFATLCHG